MAIVLGIGPVRTRFCNRSQNAPKVLEDVSRHGTPVLRHRYNFLQGQPDPFAQPGELCASLRDHDSRNTEGYIWESILVRGKELQDIDMDNIINFFTEGMGEWKYRSSTNVLVSFHQAIMFPEAKIWIQFMCTKIVPTLNFSNINTFRAVLLYTILQKNSDGFVQKDGVPMTSTATPYSSQYWNKRQQEMTATPYSS
ncbi:hypothetical protein Goarm_021592 [Gossypium armourianum]|uniref:Uncharacterized protein n=1 Tax=Gossypium armourianum TaxID=34283 RepID=A0A7J9IS82_9ROSI|nr:hypothetical protein [Gossypium armourianum]